ncbi:MAG: hypothetical protein RLZZ469_1660 [Bacteroidota bacterium]|jgi:hypothetical protein
MDQINPQKAIEFIYENAPRYAEAKATRVYLEEFKKSKKAILYQKPSSGTIGDREAYAYAHEEYLEVLNGLREAVEVEEALRWQIESARLKVEIWRTQQANNRALDNSAR